MAWRMWSWREGRSYSVEETAKIDAEIRRAKKEAKKKSAKKKK